MSSSVIPAAMDALKAAYEARLEAGDGFEKVKVFTAAMGDEEPPEAIVMVRVPSEQTFVAIGARKRDETFTIEHIIVIRRNGSGESVATAARNRAFEIFAQVEEVMRDDPTLGEIAWKAEVATGTFEQGAGDRKRYATLEFDIRLTARI